MPPTAPPRRVLVVDDSALYRRWACRALEQEGFQADVAEDGERALKRLLRTRYDAVVLDLLLPSIDGPHLLRSLKSDPRTEAIPVVAVSGQGEKAPYLTALALGASAALPKSRPESLVSTVQQAIALAAHGRSWSADVLHVEDDEQWAGLVRVWLEEQGLVVHHVSSEEELNHYLQHARRLPRSLLMDLRLGGQDGLRLCDRIKSSPSLQCLPILVLSGHASPPVESLRHQAVYHMSKSADVRDELIAALESIFRQQEHAEGVMDTGDLRLDRRQGTVLLAGALQARLENGPFNALSALLRAAPGPVTEEALYDAFLSRQPYRKADPELTVRQTVRTYVSHLRRALGPRIGARIVHSDGGYRYDESAPSR